MDKTTRLRVLIIDDHEELRVMLCRALQEQGHLTHGAQDGAVGLKVMAQHPVDLVITDLVMPDQEGIETIMMVRKQYPDVRILAMSGGHQARNAMPYLELAARLGAHGTLEKPFSIDELTLKIESILPPPAVDQT
ncbi:MAG: response regulator [Verrucomicrobiota bacterium]